MVIDSGETQRRDADGKTHNTNREHIVMGDRRNRARDDVRHSAGRALLRTGEMNVPNGMSAMIDLETGSGPPYAAILEIAVVTFDPNNPERIGPIFYRNIPEEDSADAGLRIDPDTREWWKRQRRYNIVFGGSDRLDESICAVKAFTDQVERIWAKSPIFDAGLLRDAMLRCGASERGHLSWGFQRRMDFRDVRTAISVAESEDQARHLGVRGGERKPLWGYGRTHHPVEDCLRQIESLVEVGVFGRNRASEGGNEASDGNERREEKTTAMSTGGRRNGTPPVGFDIIKRWNHGGQKDWNQSFAGPETTAGKETTIQG